MDVVDVVDEALEGEAVADEEALREAGTEETSVLAGIDWDDVALSVIELLHLIASLGILGRREAGVRVWSAATVRLSPNRSLLNAVSADITCACSRSRKSLNINRLVRGLV